MGTSGFVSQGHLLMVVLVLYHSANKLAKPTVGFLMGKLKRSHDSL